MTTSLGVSAYSQEPGHHVSWSGYSASLIWSMHLEIGGEAVTPLLLRCSPHGIAVA